MKKPGATLGGNLLLLLTAFIWGVAFVAQKSGGAELGALTFNGVRSFIGCGALLAALPLLDRLGLCHRRTSPAQRKALCTGGVLCGLALFSATNMQQLGLLYTTVGKGGFITALYIVLVLFYVFFLRSLSAHTTSNCSKERADATASALSSSCFISAGLPQHPRLGSARHRPPARSRRCRTGQQCRHPTVVWPAPGAPARRQPSPAPARCRTGG